MANRGDDRKRSDRDRETALVPVEKESHDAERSGLAPGAGRWPPAPWDREPASRVSSFTREELVSGIQGISYVLLGSWPLFASGSYRRAYEPDLPRALFKLWGVGMIGVGTALLSAAFGRRVTTRARLLGMAVPATCIGLDAALVQNARVNPAVFFEDLVHAGFATAWVGVMPRSAHVDEVRETGRRALERDRELGPEAPRGR